MKCNHNPVFSLFMTYHRVCDNRNTTRAISEALIAYPDKASVSPTGISENFVVPVVQLHVLMILVPCCAAL